MESTSRLPLRSEGWKFCIVMCCVPIPLLLFCMLEPEQLFSMFDHVAMTRFPADWGVGETVDYKGRWKRSGYMLGGKGKGTGW